MFRLEFRAFYTYNSSTIIDTVPYTVKTDVWIDMITGAKFDIIRNFVNYIRLGKEGNTHSLLRPRG